MKETIIGGKYLVGEKIGSGSFGEIYSGINNQTNDKIAIKLENVNAKHPQLLNESKLIKYLEGGLGIPKVYWCGSERGYNVMVLDLLGPSLEDLASFCNRKLTLKTVLMIVDQLICRVQYVHSKSLIHRDIKPDNFLIGYNKRCSIIYVIDFGLSKKYRDPKTLKHIPYRDSKSLTGTARYASVNSHAGIEQSRRDDLEAIAYILIYFLKGVLPWQGINAKNRDEKYRQIMNKKKSTTSEELCKDYPDEFRLFLDYTKGLQFDKAPDYTYCRNLFKTVFEQQDFTYDYLFD